MRKFFNILKTISLFIITPWWCLFDGTYWESAPTGHTSGLAHGLMIFGCFVSFVIQVVVALLALIIFGIVKLSS